MIKVILILLASVVFGAIGQIFFKKGVNVILRGSRRPLHPASRGWSLPLSRPLGAIAERRLHFFVKALQNRFIWLGIITTTLYFFLWMAVLRMADVSWALPLRSIQYLLVAVMAILFLGEKVSKKRWIGIGLVMVGIFFIVQSWRG